MRALSHCDFCGADATGTFELLPPELKPTEDEQRRVVLCSECGTRLEDLLEPLLARAGVESADGTSATDSSRPADSTDDSSTANGSDIETADDDTAPDSTDSSRPAVIDVNAAKTDPDGNEVSTDTGSDETKPADSDEPNSTESADADDRGITLERTVDVESSAETSTADSSDEDDTDSSAKALSNGTAGSSADEKHDAASSTDDGQDADSADDDGGSSNADDSTGDSGTSPPRGYGKVIRLLRNREFPMARSDVETLAAGAYDLEPHTAEEIIEYALEDGEFAEDGDQLVRS